MVVPKLTASTRIATAAAARHRRQKDSTTKLYIEKWVADMIDQELWREEHKEDYERAWMEKNRAAVLKSLGGDEASDMNKYDYPDAEEVDFRQLLRDKKLAQTNPQQYCADRCIATGYCDVYEDV